MSLLASDSASDTSSTSPPASPTKRVRPRNKDAIGISPDELVGKTLTQLRHSSRHPVISISFTTPEQYQILVDGYDPHNPGLPKHLELDAMFAPLIANSQQNPLVILDCAAITLTDKAFQKRRMTPQGQSQADLEWDQKHTAIAFKFSTPGRTPRWHCIWATREEYDEVTGECIFRSYEDVYVDKVQRRSTGNRDRRRSSVYYNG
jgi:hypothetical protein